MEKPAGQKETLFHVYTNAVTHEGKLQFKKNAVKEVLTHNNPASVTIHPYHPDTELFRYTYATFMIGFRIQILPWVN